MSPAEEPNSWILIGLTVLILAITFVLSRLAKYLVTQLMDKTTVDEKIADLLGQEDSQAVKKWSHRVVEFVVLLIGVFFTWQMFITIPAIADFRIVVDDYFKNLSNYPVASFLINLFLVVIVTSITFRILNTLGMILNSMVRKIKSDRRTYIKSFSIHKLEVFSAKQMKSFVLTTIRILRYVLFGLIIFVYFLVLFSIFPVTRGIVSAIIAYIIALINKYWHEVVGYIPSMISLLFIILITRFIIKITDFFFNRVESGTIKINGFEPEWAGTTFNLVRILLIALALVIAFPYLPGSDSPAFQGISIFIGALFSLGSTSVIGNIMAGIVMTYTSAFKVGDRVKIADTVGDVIEKTMLVTRVLTIKNVEVTIPNSMVLSSHIINYSAESQERGLILHTSITLGYDIPWRKVHEVLIAAALDTKGILKTPKPFVLQTALDDFYVHYEINAYTHSPKIMSIVYSDLHKNIQDHCNEAGIEITSPHYAAIRDGNVKSVPEEYLPQGYQPPGFHLDQSK